MRFKLPLLLIFWVALLINSAAQSVDPLTGRFQMSIPLGQLQANDITIPFGIYHNGSSLGVEDGEGSCGLGWNLQAGGVVNRQVRGLPDDYNVSGDSRKGWLFNSNAGSVQNFSPSGDDNLTDCSDEQDDWDFLEGRGYIYDTEPDIFSASAPGLSVQFVFGSDGNPKLLTYQDLKITVTKNSDQVITAFTIQNNTGTVYTFNIQQTAERNSVKWNNQEPAYFLTAYNQYQPKVSYTSAWLLSSVESLATGTTATFSYQDGHESFGRQMVTLIRDEPNPTVDTLYFISTKVTPRLLTEVNLKSYRASITWNNDVVRKITFEETITDDTKEFELTYKTISSSKDNAYPKPTRQCLSEVRQTSAGEVLPAYSFTYHGIGTTSYSGSIAFPWKTSWGQDWYGFYNGEDTNKNIPTVFFYDSESNENRFRTSVIPNATADTLMGENRQVHSVYALNGALTRIDYPTGGSTQIQYELNTYWDSSINQELAGPGARVKKIESHGGDQAYGKSSSSQNPYHIVSKEYEYRVADSVSAPTSGRLTYPAVFAFATGDSLFRSQSPLGDFPEVLYTRVKEKVPGLGYTIFENAVSGVYPQVQDGDWNATKSRIARNSTGSCISAGNIKTGYYTYPFPLSTNNGYSQGVMSRQAQYTETDTLVREKLFTYTTLSSNSQTIKGLAFEKIGGIYHYGQYEILTGRVRVVNQEISRESSEENPAEVLQTTTAFSYNANLMLEEVTTTNPDNSVVKVKTKYAKDFIIASPSSTDTVSVALKALNDSFRHGLMVEAIQKVTPVGETEKVVGASLTTYKDFGNGKILPYQLKSLPQGVAFSEAVVSGNAFVADTDYRLVTTLKEYDAAGNLLTLADNKRNFNANHYATSQGLPVATFSQAKAQECIYEGFESTVSFGLSPTSGAATYPAGWTGEKSVQIFGSIALVSSSTDLIKKGESKYRASCWVNASQATTLTIRAKNGSTIQQSITLSNPVNDQWVYLEGEMDMASVSSQFTLEIVTNGTIRIDDFLFIPKSAKVSHKTWKPLTGVTSVSDDNGNSIKYAYDLFGRLQHTFDQKRNLVERKEYLTQVEAFPVVNSGFTTSSESKKVGQQATFTAGQNHFTVTYAWSLFKEGSTPIATGTGSTFQHTFSSRGRHNLKLVTTSQTYGSTETTQEICVYPAVINPNIAVTNTSGYASDPYKNNSCLYQDDEKTISVNVNPGSGAEVNYVWSVKIDNGDWVRIVDDGDSSLEYSLQGTSSYYFSCLVEITYPVDDDTDCNGTNKVSKLVTTAQIVYVNEPYCP